MGRCSVYIRDRSAGRWGADVVCTLDRSAGVEPETGGPVNYVHRRSDMGGLVHMI